jgi:hypothetical protein
MVRGTGRLAGWRSDALLVTVVLLVTVPILQPLMTQQSSRYALTAALWDGQTVAVDDYAHLLGVDHAERDGRLYSDKAPGQPVLGVPAYAVYRALGGAPATEARVFADPGLWAVTLVSAMLPAALLAVAMRRLALRVAPRRATHAALGLVLGTLLLPFGTVLFSHVLSALLGVVAYLVLTGGARSGTAPGAGRLAAAGALAGAAVTVEYTAALVAVAVAIVAALAWRWRALWVVAGGAGPALLLGLYHWAAFGHPLQTGYQHNVFAELTGLADSARPEGWSPDPGMLLAVLGGERGLLLLTPLVAVGLVGLVVLALGRGFAGRHAAGARRRGRSGRHAAGGIALAPVGPAARAGARRDAVVGLVLLGALLLLMSGWSNPTGGASPGPRYVVPALPFLAGGVAWMWARMAPVAWVAAGVGVLTMGLATFTQPLVPRSEVALAEWWARLREGAVAQSWLTEATGSAWGLVPPLALAAVLTAWVLVAESRAPVDVTPTDEPALTA